MTTITDVRREVTVAGTPQRAFDLFTNRMAEWWPANHHLATSPVVAMTVEPRVGGRMFDTCEDGSESAWGRVTDVGSARRLHLCLDDLRHMAARDGCREGVAGDGDVHR